MSETLESDVLVGGIGVGAEHRSSGVVHLISDRDVSFATCGIMLGAGCRTWGVSGDDIRVVSCARCRRTYRFRALPVTRTEE